MKVTQAVATRSEKHSCRPSHSTQYYTLRLTTLVLRKYLRPVAAIPSILYRREHSEDAHFGSMWPRCSISVWHYRLASFWVYNTWLYSPLEMDIVMVNTTTTSTQFQIRSPMYDEGWRGVIRGWPIMLLEVNHQRLIMILHLLLSGKDCSPTLLHQERYKSLMIPCYTMMDGLHQQQQTTSMMTTISMRTMVNVFQWHRGKRQVTPIAILYMKLIWFYLLERDQLHSLHYNMGKNQLQQWGGEEDG